jgi:hypothetical protein
MRLLLPFALLGLAACYSPRSTGADLYPGSSYGGLYEEPLRASLWVDPYTSHASFELNRPAHVAIFTWQPGQHLDMVHPHVGYQARQYFVAGSHNVWNRTTPYSFMRRRAATQYVGGLRPMSGPTYYMMIASAEPLHLAPFYGTARMGWVHQASWSHNLYTATELLAAQVVPDLEHTEWTVAYHMVWHDDAQRRNIRPQLASYRWVACPGGVVIAVPLHILDAGLFGCPQGESPEGKPGEQAPGPSPRDSAAAPRRPAPPVAMQGERADEAELRSLLQGIRAARGLPTEDVEAPPIPAWRKVERGASDGAPVARATRPLIRPAVPARPAPAVRAHSPGATPASALRSPRGARHGTGVDGPSNAWPAEESARARTQRPARATERPAPRVQRPPPQAQRPSPAPAQRPSPPSAQPRPKPEGDRG